MKAYLRYLAAASILLAHPLAAQQPTHVTGQVVDAESGRPLSGVQVAVVGGVIGTLTDAQGRYVLDVPAGRDSLSFAFIGYSTVKRAVAAELNVSLRVQAVALEGVVVTALGIHREQRRLTYSAQAVSSDQLTKVPTTNLVSALQGNVAGIHVTNSSSPFGSARIVVRGASSILGQNQPLMVVDGVPIDNSAAGLDGYGGGDMGGYNVGNAASDIDANNIQSITVLKGPNAAALYGSRAANGAIVITTKNGTGAAAQAGYGVMATISNTFETPLMLPAYQNQYGQGFYGQFRFVDGNGGGLNDEADESWGPKLDGRPIDQFFGAQQPWVAHPNNVRDFWDLGRMLNLNIAVSRNSPRNNLRFSVGRSDERGMYPNNHNVRTDLALNGGLQISDKLSTEASIDYINDGMVDQPKQSYDEADPMQNFIWFGRQVDVNMLKHNLYRDPTDPLTKQILAGNPNLRTDAPIPYSWNYSYHQNPFWEAGVKHTDFARNRVLGHASVTYKFNDWLSITGRTGRDWYQEHFRANYPVNNIDPDPLGGFNDDQNTLSETNTDFLITANRPLLSNLSVTVNAGGNIRQNEIYSSSGTVTQLVIPGVYTMGNSAGQPGASLTKSSKRVNSLYGSASFNYRDWFNVDLTGRNDWSSTLPAGQNSFFYPSVGAALVFTDALGIQSHILSYGKLRASWTRVGNDTNPYQLAAVYGSGTAWAGQPTFSAPDRLPNAKLKPEQTTGEEIGADLGLFDNKLILNATLYQKSTTNQILPVSISPATGYSSAVVNSGDVRNRGIEIEANVTPVETRNFKWNVVANWSKNVNKVLSLYSGVQRIVVGTYWNINVVADSGKAYGDLVGRRFLRDDQGRIVVNSNGLPIQDPQLRTLGNYNPDWVGGLTNTFTYKDFSLSVLLDGQYGGNVYSVTKWFGDYSGVLKGTLVGRETDWDTPGFVVPNAVYQDGSADTTHVLAQDYWHNTFYSQEMGIIDASYLKLRDARLAWNLPESFVRSMGFSSATFAVVGHNLFLWKKQDIIDPETAFDTGNRQGVENAQLPTARSIGFTLTIRP
jgi:TonB-linked SusC/RagA family outer membrane protein